MSEQAKIIAEMQALIMEILQSGSATVEQGDRIDTLEALMMQQASYKATEHPNFDFQGEEIAGLLLERKESEAVAKMCEYSIPPIDLFGFIEYHYDDEDDEAYLDMLTQELAQKISLAYEEKCIHK